MKIDIQFKKVLIVSLSSFIYGYFIVPFIQTSLELFSNITIDAPLGAYLLWGYSPILLAGIFSGIFFKKNVFINGLLTGALFNIYFKSYYLLFIENSEINLTNGMYSLVRDSFMCGLVAIATFFIFARFNTKIKEAV